MAVNLNRHDLEFVLTQIKIAEAHAAGTPLDQLIVQPHLPYGLRTVDGSYNNLIPGREYWGASGQVMPRMFDPNFRDDGDGDSFDSNGPTQPGGEVTNGDYGDPGDIADADPRLISNLITDQTLNNPAAITAALQHAGLAGAELTAALQDVTSKHIIVKALSTQALVDGPAFVAAKAALDAALVTYGVEMQGANVVLPNVAPDEGLSAPFNGWMTFFGQFFDHGLDLIAKGNNGTIYVPLAADDPLRTHGPDGIAGSGDEVPDHLAFMVLTRSTKVDGPGADGLMGTADDTQGEAINKTTPYIDQNQTYTSDPSHQVFLREYAMVDGRPLATGLLLDGVTGGLPTWADIKEQARVMLGIELTDDYVHTVPLLRTDLYGEFIRDANGFPQVVVNIGPDGIPNTADDVTASGTADAPLDLSALNGGLGPVRTMHAFLDDIAHTAAPVLDATGQLVADADTDTGNAVPTDPFTGRNLAYDNELLDRHFITGDGRGNENIGLTAVHHVFHSEHNRQVHANQLEILKSGDLAFINEWLATDLAALDGLPAAEDGAALAAFAATLQWDGERLFQTARFATEMQYQHLVFEEFGRKVQPLIDLFIFNTTTDINPAIFAEFAHTVYRFGHSMLTDSMTLLPLDEAGNPVYYDETGAAQPVTDLNSWGADVGLIDAFLNPIDFDRDQTIDADQAAGAIVRGMMRVHGSEIDEFVVEALRNNLLGLPLDLPAINIARGRDAGVPTLNDARAQLFAASSSSFLKPYESWADFAANIKTPASVINFIAAYGTHASITAALTSEDKREAATLLVMGGAGAPADRLDFLNATGAYAGGSLGGLNDIDLWIGGLAEKKMPFGGFLGSTFNAVFELQMENLQENDRFYYLTRTQGLNLLNELENNAFTKLIMANTDLTDPGADGVRGTKDDIINHSVGVDSFALHDFVFELDPSKQIGGDPAGENPVLDALFGGRVVRNNPNTPEDESTAFTYFRFFGGEHIAVGGTEGDDTINTDFGDDAIWGGGGNDRIEAGAGVDLVIGGAGDDIITDSGDTGDFLKGEDGDDVIANSNGLDILMGGDGKDVMLIGVDATEVFSGEGDDFVLGGADHDFIFGNEGDDWIEGGDGFDVLNGDNSELFFNSTIKGHDVLFAGPNENDFDAESGDDIMVQGESVMRNEGMLGFDWAIHKGNPLAADSDMRIPIFTNVADDILRDRFDQTEGLSGWIHNDVLRGDDRGSGEEIEVEFNMTGHELDQAGIDRIDGLRELLGLAPRGDAADGAIAWKAGNIILGGNGNDTIEGRGGDDFVHGDAWLNVRISIKELDAAGNVTDVEAFTVDSLTQAVTYNGATKPLSEWLLSGDIKPRQLSIVREVLYDEDVSADIDTAVFAGNRDWYEITHVGDRTYVARREMEEIDPQISEGTDTLIGIERIQFADQIYTIRETGNVDPTGRLTISGLPAVEGQPLTVSAENIRDANNPNGEVTNITYRWQVERNDGTGDYINIPNVSGDTLVPTDEHTGLRIRVVGTYVDGGGVTETVTSQPTDVVIGLNDEPTGSLLISDMTPTEGEELIATAAFTDPDGMSDAFEESLLTYQWQYSVTASGPWLNVPAEEGGNARAFTPEEDQVGRYVRLVVDYTDDLGFAHQVISAVTETVGNRIVSDAAVIDGVNGDAQGGTTAGDDSVQGGASANSISGLAGADVIDGGLGADTIQGGDGNDNLSGGGGDDIISGDGGNDTIVQTSDGGADQIDGGADTDTLRIVQGMGGLDDTIAATLTGGVITQVNDAQVTSIETAQLDVGTGTDTLDYSGNADPVSVNLLSGAATGFSFIRGIENVTGGTGADTVQGNAEANTLDGGAGDDLLRGGFGADNLVGGDGADRLYGDEGDDTLNGGAGDDRIDGGAGIDTASYAGATAGVTVSLATVEPQDTVGAGLDTLVDIENLTGSGFADSLTGNAGNNLIDGGAGVDAMAGGAGDDTYVVDDLADGITEDAGGGDDTVRTSLAGYTLAANVENLVLTDGATGGTGNALDNELTGSAGDDTLDGGAGTDTVVLEGMLPDYGFALAGGNITVTSDAGGTDALISIERMRIGGIDYDIRAGTNAGNTGAGAVVGLAGADILFGFNGLDELRGEGGDDILIGGLGIDTMVGGAGNDTYVVEQGGDFVTETGGSGIDTIYASVTRNLGNAAQVTGDVENLILTGAGNINAVGNALANVLTGNAGNNTLSGLGGDDTLAGNAGDDIVNGGAGNDVLSGGDGDDTLNGQGGTGDVAFFAGGVADYSFGVVGDTLASVSALTGSGGTDTLTNVERLQFGDGASLAIVTDVAGAAGTLTATEASILFGLDGNDTVIGSDGNDIIIGGAGDDLLEASALPPGDNATSGATDDDTFIWYVGDGSDTISGGFEGAAGDVFQVVGNEEAETYRIYTVEEAILRIGFADEDAGADFEPEIVVTRQVAGGAETVIATLTEIEEIMINGANVGGNGSSGGDTFEIYGSFDTTTSLRPNTITIVGSTGNDTVNITSLRSAHRIVFRTRGGNDVIIGMLRPQDVIELPAGARLEDYETSIGADGLATLSNGTHSFVFTSEGGLPQVVLAGEGEHLPEDDDTPAPPPDNQPDPVDTGDGSGDDDDDDETPPPPPDPVPDPVLVPAGTSGDDELVGTAGDDVLNGGSGDDEISGGDGDDTLSGGSGDDELEGDDGDDTLSGGSGDDELEGGDGDDTLSGGSGDDVIDGGEGDDAMTGGSGDDRFVFGGDDRVLDFRVGSDLLDISALGVTSGSFNGAVKIKQSGEDTLVKIGGETLRLAGVDADDVEMGSFVLAGGGASANSERDRDDDDDDRDDGRNSGRNDRDGDMEQLGSRFSGQLRDLLGDVEGGGSDPVHQRFWELWRHHDDDKLEDIRDYLHGTNRDRADHELF